MLEVIDVVKQYGERLVLDRVSIEVAAGEVTALLGPNGAGKSTLVSIIAGLRAPDSGRVIVDGFDARRDPQAVRARIGVAGQDTAVYEVLSVRENLTFFAELAGVARRGRAERVDQVAHALRLDRLMDRVVSRLSGGERRRLHTAIAFLHRPAVLLLDEPTVGADIETRAALLEVVRAAAHAGAAVLYSTHYLPEVEALDASVAILVVGRIVATGSVRTLIAEHGHAALELTFDGAPPAGLGDMTGDGDTVRIVTSHPTAALPSIIARLGDDAARLIGVDVLQPSLDSVFVSLTGRRYESQVDSVAIA